MLILRPKELAQHIEHSLLRATVSARDIERLTAEAHAYNFGLVCIPPCHVKLAASLLTGTETMVCTVVGFPMGYSTTRTKVFEAAEARDNGAHEIDMVINLGLIKDRHNDQMAAEVRAVVAAAAPAKVKVIIECSELTETEKAEVAKQLLDTGAHYIKTSTGFSTWGAKEHDVRLIRQVVGKQMGIKAAGGIRDVTLALALIEAGADRLGTSSGVLILESFKQRIRIAREHHPESPIIG
jgi:deoxyribose-phosphate aldolase